MWIKDSFGGDYVNTESISTVYTKEENGTHTLHVSVAGEECAYRIKDFRRKEDAEAARDALIRKLGGEVVEV